MWLSFTEAQFPGGVFTSLRSGTSFRFGQDSQQVCLEGVTGVARLLRCSAPSVAFPHKVPRKRPEHGGAVMSAHGSSEHSRENGWALS